ncbi:MAG: cyclopropane-fatty-acyl-phospholipid synthase, partial [Methylobacter sp.]
MSNLIDNKYNKFRLKLEKLLEGSNIAFNGGEPWDIRVYNADLYERVLAQGSVGMGEAYMDGWWDSDQLDELFCKICLAKIKKKVSLNPHVIKTSLLAY